MTRSIMVTADLAHTDGNAKAFDMAAGLAKHYGADLTVVGVTMSGPTSVATSPEAFEEKLKAFAAAEGGQNGVEAKTHMVISHDPTIDLNDKLQEAVREIGADLVVMSTHKWSFTDELMAGHATHMASHAPCSVVVVR